MKNIKIKFYGLGYNDVNQACITIYDECNNKVFEGKTFNNIIKLCLNKNKLYKIIAVSKYEKIVNYFYVGCSNNYHFLFSNIIYEKTNSITFLLTDYYYDNLPIERGEIILWQK